MKKSIFTLLLCLSTFGVFAQHSSRFISNKNKVTPNQKKFQIVSQKLVENKLRFDSIVSLNSWKECYIYNSSNQLISDREVTWDNNEWVNEWRTDYNYDTNGNNSEKIEYQWNNTDNVWKENYRETYEYNSKNNKTKLFEYSWNTSWNVTKKQELYYNSAGDTLLHTEIYYWDQGNQVWSMNNDRINYYSNNRLDSTIEYNYYNQVIFLNQKEYFTYEANGKVKESVTFKYQNGWINDSKLENTYNANNDYSEIKSFNWNSQKAKWDPDYIDSITYDENLNMNRYIYYHWDSNSSSFIGDGKSVYSYNNTIVTGNLILPFYYIEDEMAQLLFRHQLINIENYNNDNGNWVFNETSNLYYSNNNTNSIKNNIVNDFKIYPNPATENISFKLPGIATKIQVKLFDVTGKCILNKEAENYQPLDISKLKRGLYYYLVTNGPKAYNGKFTKE